MSDIGNAETTQWRIRRGELWSRLGVPLLLGIVTLANMLLRLTRPDTDRFYEVVEPIIAALIVVAATLATVVVLRTRVRLRPDGLEIRELRTRTYPWSAISAVQVDRWSGYRSVKISLVNGTTRTLPAPRRPPGAKTPYAPLDEVVAAVARRLPAGPASAQDVPPTSLDDLLGD